MNDIINYIKNHIKNQPTIGIVLGSGLETLSRYIKNRIVIKYSNIPSFIDTSVDGHAGEFILGEIGLNNINVICANGRFHYYEGLSYDKTHILIDIFHQLGCQSVITTNSSGCLDASWTPGDLMVIDSHVDMTFRDTIDKIIKKSGDQYYDNNLKQLALDCMDEMNLPERIGTYSWTLGPTYETPAEIDFMKSLDIKAAGMSTIPEIERAHDLGLKLLGISCLTNYAVGISKTPLTHDEVVTQAKKSGELFSKLILNILQKIDGI